MADKLGTRPDSSIPSIMTSQRSPRDEQWLQKIELFGSKGLKAVS